MIKTTGITTCSHECTLQPKGFGLLMTYMFACSKHNIFEMWRINTQKNETSYSKKTHIQRIMRTTHILVKKVNITDVYTARYSSKTMNNNQTIYHHRLHCTPVFGSCLAHMPTAYSHCKSLNCFPFNLCL